MHGPFNLERNVRLEPKPITGNGVTQCGQTTNAQREVQHPPSALGSSEPKVATPPQAPGSTRSQGEDVGEGVRGWVEVVWGHHSQSKVQ